MERNYQRKHMVHRTNKDYWRDQNDEIIREELEEMTCEDFEYLYNSNCSVERETKGVNMNNVELLKELEDNNCHSELLVNVANFLDLDELADKLEKVNREHLWLGHLSHDLHVKREALRKELKEEGSKHPDWELYSNYV